MVQDVLIRLYHVHNIQVHQLIYVKNSLEMEYYVGGLEEVIVLIELVFKKHQLQVIMNAHNSFQVVFIMEQDVNHQH
jgi:hypothetical protein